MPYDDDYYADAYEDDDDFNDDEWGLDDDEPEWDTQDYITKKEIVDFRFYPQVREDSEGNREIFYGALFGDGMKESVLESREYSEEGIRAQENAEGIGEKIGGDFRSWKNRPFGAYDQTPYGDDIVEGQTWDEVLG